MADTAKRMKAMRARRRADGLREIRLLVPDLRIDVICRRIVGQVGNLSTADEQNALNWIESIAEFDEAR